MKDFAKKFYKSKRWQDCRNSYIAFRINVDGGLCEECKDNAGYIVHHKIYLTEQNIEDPDITLNHSNLEFVCKECHDNFEGHGLKIGKPLCRFDASGQPISLRPIDKEHIPPKFY